MKIQTLIIILCALLLETKALGQDKAFTSYPPVVDTVRIYRIRDKGTFQILYARHKKNVYKVIAEKDAKSPNYFWLMKRYIFTMVSVFPKEIGGHPTMGPGTTGFMNVFRDGKLIKIEPGRDIWDLYDLVSFEPL